MGPAHIPETIFLECMSLATEGVVFSSCNIIYAQTDGVSMGSPLGSILANIFVGFHDGLLFEKYHKPYVYSCYVDNTISIFDSVNNVTTFLAQLNSLQQSLQFNMDLESNCTLPFLDDLVGFCHQYFL